MKENKLLQSKIYLYLTEFFAGVSVMAVELGASRLLAPYFSSSQIVWTIIIGTIMIAMALGNIYGGRAADKDPDPGKLFARLIIAAVWIGLIPLVGKYVIIGVSGLLVLAIDTNYLIIAAFVSCMLIFVFPLFLLGTVTPSLVKYTMGSMEDSGRTVGKLEAFNTIGSIIGTFLPTFVTIPSDSFAFWEDNLLYEGESIYNYLQVKETDSSVALSTNVLFGVQSVAMKDGGLTGMYYDAALAAPLMCAEKESPEILVLGMGSGTFRRSARSTIPARRSPGSRSTRR